MLKFDLNNEWFKDKTSTLINLLYANIKRIF